MAAVILQIADAVTAKLNGTSWSLPFTAVRSYVPVHEIRDLADLTVTVVPKTLNPSLLDRGGRNSYVYSVDIGIQQVIGQGQMTNDEINAASDPLMTLAEEIVQAAFSWNLAVSIDPKPKCTDAQNSPIYHPAHIDERRVFTTVVTLTYRQGR